MKICNYCLEVVNELPDGFGCKECISKYSKPLRGSGSKENVGRHKNPYVSKRIDKMVPESVYNTCLSLIDAEVLKFKLELSKTKNLKK